MKTKGTVVLILSIFCLSPGLKGSGLETAATSANLIVTPSLKMLYSEINVYLQDGSALFGFLAGVEPDALVVRKDGQNIKVPRQALRRIILKTDSNLNRNMLYGLAAWLYAGNLILLRQGYQPFAFARDIDRSEYWLGFIYEPIFAACGIGLGYLATFLEKRKKVFDFGSSKETQAVTWVRFRDYASGFLQPTRVHFSVHGGSAISGFSSHYDALLGEAGYGSISSPSRYNLLRRFQVTYSLAPPLEIGLAYICASESSSYYLFSSTGGETSLYLNIEPKYAQHGCYLVGAFRRAIGQTFAGNIGLGLGVARASLAFWGFLNREVYILLPPGYWTWITTEYIPLDYKDTKTFFSGFAFAEISLRLYENLYIGISGDYLIKHAAEVPAFPDFLIPARKVRLGNAGIGFSLGWHF